MDHYQTLGVSRNCDRSTLHRAFRELSKGKHPDRFSEEERPKAEREYQRIVIAFNTLKDERMRREYDRKLQSPVVRKTFEDPAKQADKFFAAGKSQMKVGNHEAALESFKRSNHFRKDAETLYQLAMAECQSKSTKRQAVDHFQEAIRLKPAVLKYHLDLIKLLVDFGLNARAKVALEKAVAVFPKSEDLLEIGRVLDPKKYKGFLGNIFGR